MNIREVNYKTSESCCLEPLPICNQFPDGPKNSLLLIESIQHEHSIMMTTNDYQHFNKAAAPTSKTDGTDLEAPESMHLTPLTIPSPIFKHAMDLIGQPFTPDIHLRMEQMGVQNLHDLEILQESDAEKIFPDDKDIMKRRRLIKVITVLQMELSPTGIKQFYKSDTMVTIGERLLRQRLASDIKMVQVKEVPCLLWCPLLLISCMLGIFIFIFNKVLNNLFGVS